MTQVKGKKILSKQEIKKMKKTPQINFRGDFFKLSTDEQAAVTNFFNLHNAAIWIHAKLSKEAQEFIQKCIMLSSEKEQVEHDKFTPSPSSEKGKISV